MNNKEVDLHLKLREHALRDSFDVLYIHARFDVNDIEIKDVLKTLIKDNTLHIWHGDKLQNAIELKVNIDNIRKLNINGYVVIRGDKK